MLFPTGDAYMLAVQNAWTAFQDADLKRSAVELTPLGLPKPYSGGFATTFRFSTNGEGSAVRGRVDPALAGTVQWAVRCFKQDLPDLPRRYSAMQRLWSKPTDPIFVRAEYMAPGIRVGQGWYPIVKMDWVQGELLGSYIQDRLYKPAALLALAEEIRRLAVRLEQLGVAHGDLQHGNIILEEGRLRLIDYDGMFLPELAGVRVAEIGHVNYQHPGRANQHYNPRLDRFAIITIYLALQGLSKQPSLWRKYDNGDNLLFRQADFIEPDASPLLADLAGIAGLAALVERFRLICRDDFGAIPTLDVFLAGSGEAATHVVAKPSPYPPRLEGRPSAAGPIRRQYPVVDATSVGALSEYVGSRIEVIGRISQYFSGRTNTGTPYLFLNFGEYPKRTLTVVVWSRVLQEMQALGVEPLAYVGKSVRVTGVVTMYEGRPQMELESASQIRVIISDARSVDDLFAPDQTVSESLVGQPVDGKRAQVLNTLYHNWPADDGRQVNLPRASAAAQAASTAAPRSNLRQPSPSAASRTNQGPSGNTQAPQPGRSPAASGKARATQAAQAATRPASQPSPAAPRKTAAPVAAPPTATINRPRSQDKAEWDCFVATVTFGGPDVAEVQILRRYRDQVLSQTWAGQSFIRAYYRYGPALARFVQAHPRLRQLSAAALSRLAAAIEGDWR